MQVTVKYTEDCLPDYFRGDSDPWVAIPYTDKGYSSVQLRRAVLSEFELNAVGGSHWITADYIPDPELNALADKFYAKALPACLNREIKYRGKLCKLPAEYRIRNRPSCMDHDTPCLYIVFKIDA